MGSRERESRIAGQERTGEGNTSERQVDFRLLSDLTGCYHTLT